MAHNNTQPQMPTPDPALGRLDRFVGTWSMEGHLVGSDENNIKGTASYRWLPGVDETVNVPYDISGHRVK